MNQTIPIMLRKDYESGRIKGWAGEDVAKYEWDLIKGSSSFKRFQLKTIGSTRRMMLFDIVRKVLGEDTPNYGQEIGDCVSFGMKNAIEYLMCCEILLKGDTELFKAVFPPYLYGTGRVYVGRGQLGNEDGSLGSWMADGVIKYGLINSDATGVPPYSGNIAKTWGGPNGKSHLDKWVALGKQHLVKAAAKINTWDQLVIAICNGYPVTIASGQGFSMNPDAKGFHQASGEWQHQMCIIGVDDEYPEEYAIILNSWGDAHGQLKDFTTGEKLPIGVLRVKKSVISHMLNSGEGFAISNLDGFPNQNQKIEKALFKLI